jgi:hypothetical protein
MKLGRGRRFGLEIPHVVAKKCRRRYRLPREGKTSPKQDFRKVDAGFQKKSCQDKKT